MKPKLRFKEFSDEWEEKKLGEILTVNSGKDYKHLHGGDIPVYGTGGIIAHVNQFLSSKDGIGIGRKGTIDKPIYLKAPYWTVDTLFYCLTKFSNEFVFNICQRINWKKYDESTGVPSLSKQNIEKIKVCIPLISEQEKIGEFFSLLDDRIEKQEKRIELLKERKKGWMQKIFNQEIRFKDENGNDYPDWESHSVAEFGDIITGNTPSKSNTEFYSDSHGYVWVTPTDISDNRYISKSSSLLTQQGAKRARKLPRYTLLVTCIASIGKNAILTCEGSCNQQINAIIPNDNYCVDFLYSLMEQNKQILESNAGQTATKIINKTDFSTLRFKVPSLPEQEKIAGFLSKQDELIEQEEKKLELLKEQKKGLLQQMFV